MSKLNNEKNLAANQVEGSDLQSLDDDLLSPVAGGFAGTPGYYEHGVGGSETNARGTGLHVNAQSFGGSETNARGTGVHTNAQNVGMDLSSQSIGGDEINARGMGKHVKR